jgi:hypothetical protein
MGSTEVVSYAAALAVSSVKSGENSYRKITSQENAGIQPWSLARTAVMSPGAAASYTLERDGACDLPGLSADDDAMRTDA